MLLRAEKGWGFFFSAVSINVLDHIYIQYKIYDRMISCKTTYDWPLHSSFLSQLDLLVSGWLKEKVYDPLSTIIPELK